MSDYRLRVILNENFQPVIFRSGGRNHHQIFLEIASEKDPDLEEVLFVEYFLHHTFKQRQRITHNRKENFRIELKAWGTFVVKVTLGMADNTTQTFEQDMKEVLERKSL